MADLTLSLTDATLARIDAEDRLRHARNAEHAHKLVDLARRLHARAREFRRNDLFLAFHLNAGAPALYLVRRDHTAWCRVWWCWNAFRLDADDPPWTDCSFSRVERMKRDLSGDPEIAERAILEILNRGQLVLGRAYLPGDLLTIDDRLFRELPAQTPLALPPPTIEATAVAVRPAAPAGLRPVPLRNQPKPPRKGWFWR